MTINDLARDTIEAIFDLHVYVLRGSRNPLLLTCRQWYNVATTQRSLWRSISFGHGIDVPPEAVFCHDLRGLALLVSRAGLATFDLHIGAPIFEQGEDDMERFISSVDPNWLSRCRSLALFPQIRGALKQRLDTLFRSCDFGELERLEIRHEPDYDIWESTLRVIMERIHHSALKIRALHVRIDGVLYNTSWITGSIFFYPQVLHRFSSLKLMWTCEPVPWEEFQVLDDLELWSHTQISPRVNWNIPLVNRLTIGYLNNLGAVPLPVWGILTHLTFNSVYYNGPMEFSLPGLVFLTLIRYGPEGDLQCFQAPKLRDLAIRLHPKNDSVGIYPLLGRATITPRIIHIDIQDSEDPDTALTVFGIPFPLWEDVEDLQLRVLGASPLLPSLVIEALSGVLPQRGYPKLKCLTVLYPFREEIDEDPDEVAAELHDRKEAAAEQMRSILESRICKGESTHFEKLELQWYLMRDEDGANWRVVEWKDCL